MNIEVNLSKKSINDAIKQLRSYQESLNDKNHEFVTRLAKLGIPVINAEIARAEGDSDKEHSTMILYEPGTDSWTAKLVLMGEDILFIEFGAGRHYNENDPEHAVKFGYGVGTYPGQTHAEQDGWWYYDENHESKYSQGTQATSPMLKASHEIIANIRKIAREVYGSK